MAFSSSSSSTVARKDNYEVFISFNGDDVRRSFLSHLYRDLKSKQIQVFIDNDLERGQDINESLLRIIEGSDLSIIIFSRNYPNSEWCLGELKKIHECKKERNQIVVPVFYQVDPSDVQELKGNYSIQSQSWRNVLVEISNLSGFVSGNTQNDAKLIEDIVGDVDMKLSETFPIVSNDEDGLFGIDSSIKDVVKLLRLDLTSEARMVGIWGMGGLGKTTLATKVFDKIHKSFGGHCLVQNVNDRLCKDGLEKVTEMVIQELFQDKNITISSVSGTKRRRLIRMKILLVLDDVHTCMQLNSLLKSCGCDSFSRGSRIIVTSRDSQVLKSVSVRLKSDIYEVKQLENDDALRLLSWHAFGQKTPKQGYENISQVAVQYSKGVPLALEVLGLELRGKEIQVWENALEKFHTIGPPDIQKILRISFDGLDREEKNIFLDIACFFNRYFRKELEDILECLGFHARIGVDRLIDKSLIKDDRGWILMHDLLVQMGQEIVAEEKESKGQQSRLWKIDDIKDALTNNRGSENVEGIQIYVSFQIDIYDSVQIDISNEAFSHMHKLRYLYIDGLDIKCTKGLQFFPNSIRYLTWQWYPLQYFPSNYSPDKLVVLDMLGSNLVEINWSEPLMNLKRIYLYDNRSLIRISDLGLAPNLEHLELTGCTNLVKIGRSLEKLNKLTSLNVHGCESLSHLPELPCCIRELGVEGSGLRELPSTIVHLTLLKQLSLKDCYRLESLPSSISSLSSLDTINLDRCRNLRELPEDIGNLRSLKLLAVRNSGLRELPQSIQNLHNLIMLHVEQCKELQSLPVLPSNLEQFYARACKNDISSTIVDQFLLKVHHQPEKVHRLCVNGSQLPDWILFRDEHALGFHGFNSRGPVISLQHKELSGSNIFIFCVVCSPGLWIYGTEVLATIEYDGISGRSYRFKRECARQIPQDEVVILWTAKLNCRYVTEVSFKLLNCNSTMSIIKCGVHPLSYNQ